MHPSHTMQQLLENTVNFSKTKAYFIFLDFEILQKMALSTCSMASVVTASFLVFNYFKHILYSQVTVSVAPVLFCEFLYLVVLQ
jgi:hypothetical protein